MCVLMRRQLMLKKRTLYTNYAKPTYNVKQDVCHDLIMLSVITKLAATLRGSRPVVQSASLIMTSLMTSELGNYKR